MKHGHKMSFFYIHVLAAEHLSSLIISSIHFPWLTYVLIIQNFSEINFTFIGTMTVNCLWLTTHARLVGMLKLGLKVVYFLQFQSSY